MLYPSAVVICKMRMSSAGNVAIWVSFVFHLNKLSTSFLIKNTVTFMISSLHCASHRQGHGITRNAARAVEKCENLRNRALLVCRISLEVFIEAAFVSFLLTVCTSTFLACSAVIKTGTESHTFSSPWLSRGRWSKQKVLPSMGRILRGN